MREMGQGSQNDTGIYLQEVGGRADNFAEMGRPASRCLQEPDYVIVRVPDFRQGRSYGPHGQTALAKRKGLPGPGGGAEIAEKMSVLRASAPSGTPGQAWSTLLTERS